MNNVPRAVALLTVAALAAISLPGCASSGGSNVALVRPTAGAIGVTLLASTKDAAKRTEYAKYMFAAATAIRTLTGEGAPTPQQVEATVNSFLPSGSDSAYVRLAASLAAQYATVYVKFPVGSPELQKYLEGLAQGLEDAAAPYVPKSASTLRLRVWQMRHGFDSLPVETFTV